MLGTAGLNASRATGGACGPVGPGVEGVSGQRGKAGSGLHLVLYARAHILANSLVASAATGGAAGGPLGPLGPGGTADVVAGFVFGFVLGGAEVEAFALGEAAAARGATTAPGRPHVPLAGGAAEFGLRPARTLN